MAVLHCKHVCVIQQYLLAWGHQIKRVLPLATETVSGPSGPTARKNVEAVSNRACVWDKLERVNNAGHLVAMAKYACAILIRAANKR